MYKILLIFASLFALPLATSTKSYDLQNANQYFEDFIRQNDKQYVNETVKYARFQIFKANLAEVNNLNEESDNSTGPHAVFDITKFMDLTAEEFSSRYTGLGPEDALHNILRQSQCRQMTDNDISNTKAPEVFDWRQQNVVTPVKNQGSHCQSCYSFSTTGHLEAQMARKYSKPVSLSEQQIVDCDKRSYGCRGGFMTNSFMSIMALGGIMRASNYPYTARQGRCRFNQKGVVAKVTGCFAYRLRSQEKVKHLLYKTGPVAIAVKANGFQKYSGGVMPDAQCNNGPVNHAVLLVGYGTDPRSGPYWLVKNSYGTQFGEQGYFRMQRGERATSCGLMNDHMVTATIA